MDLAADITLTTGKKGKGFFHASTLETIKKTGVRIVGATGEEGEASVVEGETKSNSKTAAGPAKLSGSGRKFDPPAETEQKFDFMLSHSTNADGQLVAVVDKVLKGFGYQVFFDKDGGRSIPVGSELEKRLSIACWKSTLGVVFLSGLFLESDWCQREANTFIFRATQQLKPVDGKESKEVVACVLPVFGGTVSPSSCGEMAKFVGLPFDKSLSLGKSIERIVQMCITMVPSRVRKISAADVEAAVTAALVA